MDENLLQQETQQDSTNQQLEPEISENSQSETVETASEAANLAPNAGESVEADPAQGLILGKFKTVDDLSKAYEELERSQGRHSDELGVLRKEANALKQLQEVCSMYQNSYYNITAACQRDMEKYNSPEYFQDPTFREMYREAVCLFGEDFDTDKFVNLLETYVSARIFANDRKKAANNENQQVLNSMNYSKNSKSSFTPPKKRFDEMTDKEIDELLERRI